MGLIKLKLVDLIRKTNILKEFRKIKEEVEHKNLNLIQRDKIISLLIHIKENVPFYESLLNNFSEDEIEHKPYEILKSLPIVNKEDISKNTKLFISKIFFKHEKAYTGGSTGDPFRFFIDKKSISRTRGYLLYFWNKAIDFKLNDITIVIGGTSIKSSRDFKGRFYNFLQSRIPLEGGVLDEPPGIKELTFAK